MSGRIGTTSIIAFLIVVGSFAYFIVRGSADTTLVAILSAMLGTVTTWAFASHIANGAADKALNARIASTDSQNVIVSADPQQPQV